MDFGVDIGLVCSSDNSDSAFASFLNAAASDPETKQKCYGSGFLKQERSGNTTEGDLRGLKVSKISEDFSAYKAMLLQQQRSPLLRSNSSLFSDGQQMLCFSSPNSQTESLPYYPSAYSKNAGYGSGGLNAAIMHGFLTGVRGPFTPSQWMELEHQALIYKYITSNSPVPSNLLIPIRKALESAGLSSFPGAHLRPSALGVGWGSFHLGFSNNSDPEPGRCRRTDGKKWRCSRDAVCDQKYCERHMNRGRHRSRKPVEGQTGQHSSGTTNSAAAKFLPMSTSTSAASVVPVGGTSNSLGLSHHQQLNNLQHGAPNSSASPHLKRSFLNKDKDGEKIQDTTGLSMLTPTIGLKENHFPIQKQQNPYQEPSRTEFGLVFSDSFLNPFEKSSSLITSRNYGSSEDINDRENKSQHLLRQFMDDWPKNQSERSTFSWPDLDLQSDRTQLSISIPMAASDFMSSTSSPTSEKLALSPLRLSRELDSTQMGLGMNTIINEPTQRQANWIPISLENSMGGPLGEVLHSRNNSASDCKNASYLDLMNKRAETSPWLASSPTGVLQKTFRSLSNSSAGSSPRTENNLLGSNLVNASLPTL